MAKSKSISWQDMLNEEVPSTYVGEPINIEGISSGSAKKPTTPILNKTMNAIPGGTATPASVQPTSKIEAKGSVVPTTDTSKEEDIMVNFKAMPVMDKQETAVDKNETDTSRPVEKPSSSYSDWEYLLAGATPLLVGMLSGDISSASIGGQYLVNREKKKEESAYEFMKQRRLLQAKADIEKNKRLTKADLATIEGPSGEATYVEAKNAIGQTAKLPINEQAQMNAEEMKRYRNEQLKNQQANLALREKSIAQQGSLQSKNQLLRLRKDYESNPVTVAANRIGQFYANIKGIMAKPQTAESDYALTMSIGKMYDQNSAVLEGERAVIERAQSVSDQIANFKARYLQDKSQKLTPGQRKEFFSLVTDIAEMANRKQEKQREGARYAAKAIGVDPVAVISDTISSPYPFKVKSRDGKFTTTIKDDAELRKIKDIDYEVINE